MYLTVEDLKKHLNVDHSEDDVYISELIEVAEDHVATILNAQLSNIKGGLKPSPTDRKTPTFR